MQLEPLWAPANICFLCCHWPTYIVSSCCLRLLFLLLYIRILEVLWGVWISVSELISTCKKKLGLTLFVPWKVHIVVSHIEPQLDITGEGLGKESSRLENLVIPKILRRWADLRGIANTNHSKRILAEVKRFVCKRFTILEM